MSQKKILGDIFGVTIVDTACCCCVQSEFLSPVSPVSLCPLLFPLIFLSILLLFSLLSSGRPSSPTLLWQLQTQTPLTLGAERLSLCLPGVTLWCGGGPVCLVGLGCASRV